MHTAIPYIGFTDREGRKSFSDDKLFLNNDTLRASGTGRD